MKMVFRGVQAAARVARGAGSFGANVIMPAFGIPRPWNYLAAAFWLLWLTSIGYAIATR